MRPALASLFQPADDAGGLIDAVARMAEPWGDLYANSTPVSTAVLFAHLAALLVAGGLALAADRGTLRAARDPADGARPRQLAELARTHGVVVPALGAVAATGALLALAEVGEYARSVVFWIKMALVALLLANGWLMTRAERGARADVPPVRDAAWARLRTHARLSVALWMATLLAGTILSSA